MDKVKQGLLIAQISKASSKNLKLTFVTQQGIIEGFYDQERFNDCIKNFGVSKIEEVEARGTIIPLKNATLTQGNTVDGIIDAVVDANLVISSYLRY